MSTAGAAAPPCMSRCGGTPSCSGPLPLVRRGPPARSRQPALRVKAKVWHPAAPREAAPSAAALGAPSAGALAPPVAIVASCAAELGWRTDFDQVYTRTRLVGSGSFGQVHSGLHQESGLEIAVKTLPKMRGKLSREKTLSKIERETNMLHRLQGNRGVIRLLECFEDDDSVQIVTELCPGGDLHKFVETHGPLDETHLAMVAYEVLTILKGLHERGIIHGDVKPANFCLKTGRRGFFGAQTPSEGLKAIDFGCSQLIPASRRMSKRTGTPVFMAPEIFARDYSEKADVWSVGVMLYWLYCRRFPCFTTSEMVKQARLDEVADAVTHGPITYDGQPWDRMSEQGLSFVKMCLNRNEAARPAPATALQHAWLRPLAAREAAWVAQANGAGPAASSDGLPAPAA